MSAGELAIVIPLHRFKAVSFLAPPARLVPVEKWPPKSGGLRYGLRQSRWGLVATDVLAGLTAHKYAHRAQRRGKLRLFRVFKLFGDLKRGERPAAYRALPERVRTSRWLRRL
jgi:hypothetical protein